MEIELVACYFVEFCTWNMNLKIQKDISTEGYDKNEQRGENTTKERYPQEIYKELCKFSYRSHKHWKRRGHLCGKLRKLENYFTDIRKCGRKK